jgi:arsenate reductase (thioredoxin)
MLRLRMTATVALALWVLAPVQAPTAEHATSPETVLFVCEHGSVKSLLAKLLFERAAEREGLKVQAVSRGISPDAEVPDWMRAALTRDGFNIGQWRPTALSAADIHSAHRVVAFDVALPPDTDARPALERWDGLPSVSEDYLVGREAIASRIDELVRELKASLEAS